MSADPESGIDVLGQVIRAAGRREPAPDALRDRVFAAAASTLEAKLGGQRRRTVWQTAAAAVLVAAVGAGVLSDWTGESPPVALSDQFVGEATYRAGGRGPWLPLLRDRRLRAGSEVRSGAGGRVGLVLARGASLRLNEATAVRLVGPTRVEVMTGTVYVDSRVVGAPVEIVTPVAVTRDVGTQFEVRYQDSVQQVRVREGAVLMRLGGTDYRSRAGEQLLVSAAGTVERSVIPVSGASWEWVQLVSRAPEIENRPLTELLDWAARETGRPVLYESSDVQAQAQATILHGSVRNLTPLPALQAVLATTDLELAILDDGSLLVKGRAWGGQVR